MTPLQDKVVFITGASRGIGKAMALKLAKDGARIIVTGKTAEKHATLEGTIHETVDEIKALGGDALAVQMDVRFEDQIQEALKQGAQHFGGIDIVINNASAIRLMQTEKIESKVIDLMLSINMRGTILTSKNAIPYLKEAQNPHILTLAPPLSMHDRWFKNNAPYTLSKYAMSLAAYGLSAELKHDGIASNCLWPKTVIDTAALRMLGGAINPENCRKPDIMADAAAYIFTRDSRNYTGQFLIDEDVLKETGVHDFTPYAVNPDKPLMPDLFVE